MAEEMRPEAPFGVQGSHENIWHIAAAERWSDGQVISVASTMTSPGLTVDADTR